MNIRAMTSATRFEQVFWVPTTGSTNADVVECARQGGPEGFVLVAGEQLSGRGRRDRTWVSPPGASVSMSLLLRPTAALKDWGWLSLLAGMGVAQGLRALTGAGARISLKWPNDVLVDGLKVCGILSERSETSLGPAATVGIGINLAFLPDELPVPQATSLLIAGLPHDLDQVVAAVLIAFEQIYADWLMAGPPIESYCELCASIGVPLTITAEQDQFSGVGVGIDPDGRLLVEAEGITRAFAVGDVVHARLS